MKPLALNLSKVKKVGGDKHHSIFKHPDGHEIKVAHSGISALQRKQIEKMPIQKFADGSSGVEIPQNSTPASMGSIDQEFPKEAPVSSMVSSNPSSQVSDLGMPQEQAMLSRPVSKTDVQPKVTQSSLDTGDKSDPTTPQNLGEKSYNMGINAIGEQQRVDSEKSRRQADITQNDLQERQDFQQKTNDNQNKLLEQRQHFMNDYQADHINPNHYMESMSAGEKVASGIGLFLGGFSSAFTHNGNPAMDYLNKQIDRDIQAQQSKKDQQKTLLGANQAMFHDDIVAANQTRVNMNDIYLHKIQLAAEKLGTPEAKAKADMAAAQFGLQNEALLRQNAVRATTLEALKGGGKELSAIDLSSAGIIPQQEATKEQASIDAQKTAIQKTHELYDALEKEQTAGNLLNPQSHRRVQALNAELVNAVMNASASKRLTKESVEAEIEPLEMKTSDSKETMAAKRQGILNIVQRHADPTPYMNHFAPKSLPSYGGAAPSNPLASREGQTGTLPNGQKVVVQNGRVVPVNGK